VYELAILTLFPAAVIFAACMDLVSMTIPNRISLFLIAAFLCLAPFAGMSWSQFGGHLAAGAIVLAVTFAMFFARLMGGGDAKLLAAIALWVGMDSLLAYVLLAAVCGGLLALGLLFFRTLPLPLAMAKEAWIGRLYKPRGDIPYGIALSAAALWIYPDTIWMTGLAH
jgi:prepilin peptidase CpaA